MESSRTTTSRLCSTRRLAFSRTISATWMWRCGGSSKVELMTSPLTVRCMSVTSSGRSSINRTIRATSAWLVVTELAMDCRIMVFPVRGDALTSPRWPLPTGKIVVFRGAEEAEAVGEAFEHAFGENEAVLLRLRAEDLEDQLLFAQPRGAGDVVFLGDFRQVGDVLFFQFCKANAHIRVFLELFDTIRVSGLFQVIVPG